MKRYAKKVGVVKMHAPSPTQGKGLTVFRVQNRPSSINVNLKTTNLTDVIHPFYRLPDGNGVASTTGDHKRYGMSCHYKNGVEGYCAPGNACPKEQQEVPGYNRTWKCPYQAKYGSSQVCCLYPGEEDLLPGEENALSSLKSLC